MKKIIIALIITLLVCSCVTNGNFVFDMRISEPAYQDSPSELLMSLPEEESPVEPPMVGAMITIRTDEEGAHLESNSPDALTTSASTGAYAPSLPPTTLEEETYNGRTRYLNRAVSSSSPSVYETSIWDVSVKPVPPFESEDGRGSTLIVDPNYYIELGDDWDSSGWSDEPSRPTEPGTYRVYGSQDFSIPTEPSSYDIHIYPNKDPNPQDNPFNMDDEFKFNVQPQN